MYDSELTFKSIGCVLIKISLDSVIYICNNIETFVTTDFKLDYTRVTLLCKQFYYRYLRKYVLELGAVLKR